MATARARIAPLFLTDTNLAYKAIKNNKLINLPVDKGESSVQYHTVWYFTIGFGPIHILWLQ